MLLLLQTEDENDAFVAAIGAIMEKGEESNTPNELNFIGLVAPIVQAYEQQLYGHSNICTECAKRIKKEDEEEAAKNPQPTVTQGVKDWIDSNQRTKVTLVQENSDV